MLGHTARQKYLVMLVLNEARTAYRLDPDLAAIWLILMMSCIDVICRVLLGQYWETEIFLVETSVVK